MDVPGRLWGSLCFFTPAYKSHWLNWRTWKRSLLWHESLQRQTGLLLPLHWQAAVGPEVGRFPHEQGHLQTIPAVMEMQENKSSQGWEETGLYFPVSSTEVLQRIFLFAHPVVYLRLYKGHSGMWNTAIASWWIKNRKKLYLVNHPAGKGSFPTLSWGRLSARRPQHLLMEILARIKAVPRSTTSEQKSPSVAFQWMLSLSTHTKDTHLTICSHPYFPNPLCSPNSSLALDVSLVIPSPSSNTV